MNKFKFYFFVFCSTFILFSCNKSDGADDIVVRDFDVQYQDDMEMIEEYLNTHYITNIDASPTQDFEIRKITPTENFPSMMSTFVAADVVSDVYPQLRKKAFEYNDKTYQIYYIKLKADNTDPLTLRPSRVDGVLSSYRGSYLHYDTDEETEAPTLNATVFEYTPFPVDFLTLDLAIRGWTEVFPFFKAGNKTTAEGQPTVYTDFDAGAVFIPSGFAYFNRGQFVQSTGITIPSYSPLVFTFKLLEVKKADQDGDGVLSDDEDLNLDGDFTNDDTDGDEIQNLYDGDDDGDGYLTRFEVLIPGTGTGTSNPAAYYPFNGAAEDNPATDYIDERQGIPRKFTGPLDPITRLPTPLPEDYTDPTRLRRHLDPTAFPPFQ